MPAEIASLDEATVVVRSKCFIVSQNLWFVVSTPNGEEARRVDEGGVEEAVRAFQAKKNTVRIVRISDSDPISTIHHSHSLVSIYCTAHESDTINHTLLKRSIYSIILYSLLLCKN